METGEMTPVKQRETTVISSSEILRDLIREIPEGTVYSLGIEVVLVKEREQNGAG